MPDPYCPVCRTAEIVCGKWTLLIVRDLSEGRSRFCELERSLGGISPRTLSLRLRALEEEGIVHRRTFPEVPPRVEYALTEKGFALVPIIDSMRTYGSEWLGANGSCAEAPERPKSSPPSLPSEPPAAIAPAPAGGRQLAAKRPRMHNRALHDSLAAFVEEAAWQLAEEVSGGAEVPFELDATPTRSAPLYCYRPLTGRFLAQRAGMLARLPSLRRRRPRPRRAARPDRLPAAPRPRVPAGPIRAQHAEAALQAFLGAVWARRDRLRVRRRALRSRLRRAGGHRLRRPRAERRHHARRGPRDRVRRGAARRRPQPRPRDDARRRSRRRCPRTRTRPSPCSRSRPSRATAARSRPRAAACAGCRPRCACGTTPSPRSARPPGPAPTAAPGCAVPLATGIRRPQDDCLLGAEEEDPLRAFCGLVARRTPRAGELAWALRRFELGCERGSAVEALTDWLLAARALFADTDRPGYDARRRAARRDLRRGARAARARAARARGDLARARRDGRLRQALARRSRRSSPSSARCLRAVLRDVLCGHLDPALRQLADELLEQV